MVKTIVPRSLWKFLSHGIRVQHHHTLSQAPRKLSNCSSYVLIKQRMASTDSKDYTAWSNEDLIGRIRDLEQQVSVQRHTNGTRPTSPSARAFAKAQTKEKARSKRRFDPSKYTTHLIVLKLSYLGQKYNGFEHHANNTTPLPTIEEELWKALMKTKLIFPTNGEDWPPNWDGCEYSKCGRTDKGVSAFGQVIVLRVRSSKPLVDYEEIVTEDDTGTEHVEQRKIEWHHVQDELAYPKMLNRVLPPDIRIQAWCPAPHPEFSARFSCKERRYRYFFTQPAFVPRPGAAGINDRGGRDGWLDIPAMQQAAQYFEGLHDFRNFCKVDPSKQLSSFDRRVFVSEIREATSSTGMPEMSRSPTIAPMSSPSISGDETEPSVYEFRVSGSGFLWHQVRHMVAMLFLVGQGLEKPEVVRDLLDIQKHPTKPQYDMADDAPLVLWDCIFPVEDGDQHVDALEWILPEDQTDADPGKTSTDGRYGLNGVNEAAWSQWRSHKIDEVLASSLLDVTAAYSRERGSGFPAAPTEGETSTNRSASIKVFHGGNTGRLKGQYVPLLARDRNLPVDEQNRRYLVRKGISSENTEAAAPLTSDEAGG